MQREALAQFVHRSTRDHIPQWARFSVDRRLTYHVQFDSDADWLAHTHFRVTESGKLDRRVRHCESSPTWPDNPELRRTVAA